MFKDERTGVTIHAPLGDTLIRATMRPQDLIPAFLNAIRETDAYPPLRDEVHPGAWGNDDHEWWVSWECTEFLNEDLWEAMDAYAPDGYYFGSTEGDASDYGYWLFFDEEE